jgi:hydroxyacyl-ACP dehydratase HTD2-like protein with hotdog domain
MVGVITTEDLAAGAIVQQDVAARAPLQRLAACHPLLGCLNDERGLPPLWHWLHFLDAAPEADLGADGHRKRGAMVAHDAMLPARMWAGGRMRFAGAPAPGDAVRRQTRVHTISERQGSSGLLRFVTLLHVVAGEDGVLLEEEQDLVFRALATARRSPQAAPPAPATAVTHVVVPDSVLLFRFSALTFNAHRIHYDAPYASSVEHYPGLVVHGPLQVVLLMALLRAAAPGAALQRLDFRGQAAAFVDRPLQLEVWQNETRPGFWHLQTRDPSGALCMVAHADIL